MAHCYLFILWVIIQCYAIYFVDQDGPDLAIMNFSSWFASFFFFFFLKALPFFLALCYDPASSYIFPALVLELAISLRRVKVF